ncbi:MAG: right-handed parallel beta-helix repeat-containing protein [Clostridia bacterium]|nr:right-handed parallel beta-helix repeat-containing protein [Clostridia bacterium]
MSLKIIKTSKTVVDAKSIEEGLSQVKALAKASEGQELSITLELHGDRYHLKEPVLFSAEKDPCLSSVRLTLKGSDVSLPIISGARYFYNDRFEKVEGKPYYKYQLDKDENGEYPLFREFFVDRKRIPMAKSEYLIHPFPRPPKEQRGEKENLRGLYMPIEAVEKLASENLSSAELHMLLEWEHKAYRILGVDLTATKEEGGKTYALVELDEEFAHYAQQPVNEYLTTKNRRCYICNSLAFIEPGSFVYDYNNGIAYYYPAEGYNIVAHTQEYPVLENLLMFEGLRGLTLENLCFTATTSKHLCKNGYNAGQANVLGARLQNAAVFTRNMRGFTATNCSFEELGGNGLLMLDANIDIRIEKCRFENVGMSGIFIGNANASLSAWEDPQNRNIDIHIVNNYMHHIAYDYPTACAFYISLVDGLEFTHNTIRDVAYSALSAGWNWCQVPYSLGEKVNVRDADIAFNFFEDYMMVLEDGGATYVNGGNCSVKTARLFNKIHDNYAVCHQMRDRARYGYYMDGAASNWECYHNVVINANLPVFAQPHPQSLSCHVHIRDIYANTPYEWYMGAPASLAARDVVVTDYHLEESEEVILNKHPEALAIKEKAGCCL